MKVSALAGRSSSLAVTVKLSSVCSSTSRSSAPAPPA